MRELVTTWRERAAFLESLGATTGARAFTLAAKELDEALASRDDELLNLRQAAEESGYTDDHLGRQVRDGKIPNSGRENAPKIRRGDLPRKPGYRPPPAGSAVDREQIVLRALGRIK